jgi:phosphoesterase family protein
MKTKAFERIFIIMFENELAEAVLGNPYMKSLSTKGVYLTNSFGVSHPSQPNYLASISGATWGFAGSGGDNCRDVPDVNAATIVDLLENKGITWKAYMENMPADNKTVCIDGLYFRKHNPFVSFNTINSNGARMARIVNANELQADINNNTLPQYSWYTPNIQNDGHTILHDFEPNNPMRNVNFLAQWLESFLTSVLTNPNFTKGTLVVITFDESIPYDNNHTYTVLLGDMVQPQTVHERYDHYSLLRTVEENFDLGSLGKNDQDASWYQFLWGMMPAFNWADHHQSL